MHPLVEDVHRADPIAMGSIATGATAVGAACHLGEVTTVRTRLRRVRLTNLDQLDAVTTELVCQVVFQPPELQRPDLLIGASGPAMPFVMVQRAEIAGVQDRNLVSDTKRDDLIGRMMQGIAGDPFHFLADSMSGPVQTLASS